jgi:hypothetical protein
VQQVRVGRRPDQRPLQDAQRVLRLAVQQVQPRQAHVLRLRAEVRGGLTGLTGSPMPRDRRRRRAASGI